jgi:hypothetical protein
MRAGPLTSADDSVEPRRQPGLTGQALPISARPIFCACLARNLHAGRQIEYELRRGRLREQRGIHSFMISETDLMWWCSLNKCKSLKDIKSVCDLGLQEVLCAVPATYEKVTRTFAALCGEPGVSLADCGSSAEMWRRLKREIVSLDIVGADLSLLPFDLNADQVPEKLRSHFDFVTNAGTTEHVFNQVNCFKVIHDLTKVGGIMAHVVPFAGFENHGFFNYSMRFFTTLARDNGYACLDAWISMELEDRRSKPGVADFFADSVGMFRTLRSGEDHPIQFYRLNYADYRTADACIYVFLRKENTSEFKFPMDLPEGVRAKN